MLAHFTYAGGSSVRSARYDMSPFSSFLKEMRLRHGIRQAQLADLLGYEQSYISALELGVKGPPTPEFVLKLIKALALTPVEQQQVHKVVSASQRKLALDPESPEDVYWMLNDLREQLPNLHPAQVQMIQQALNLRGSLVDPQSGPIRRIKRRRKEEATM